mgnify:CR=1 FL=1
MRFLLYIIIFVLLPINSYSNQLLGFDTQGSKLQYALEKEFDSKINAEEMDEWLKLFSSKPHHVGSPANKEVVKFVADLFESWGYQVEIEEYKILLPTPETRELTLIKPEIFHASLSEDSLNEDPSTFVRDNLLPPYNAFSTDGNVEGELVFVNYGIPEDYDLLERYGIDVAGKIAIAKYGKSWRGIKPKLAGENGAIGTIIYSDPADDGYGAGDVYPKGPFKHRTGVQRGSVMDMPTYPGDVLTPGRGATKSAKRLKVQDAPTITKIPVLPISYQDALPLLRSMGGSVVPSEWRGDLPITYHLGPGPSYVKLNVKFNWNFVTAYNVIAKLEGQEYPDEWVIRGNHHDGWNHGAADPISGLVAMLSEAKAVAELSEKGKTPSRTIIYAAWDAEEPGLIGSTEWAEDHATDLKKHAVAYLNTDGNSRGFINIGGSHTLERFFNQIMEDVDDPRLGISIKDRKRAYLKLNANKQREKSDATERKDLRIYPMGSGSDYTPFLQHLGIASANFGFGGEGGGGSYHTLYDTYEHFTAWRDPDLIYGETLAKVAGRATLRLANASRLPFEYLGFADNIALYIQELEELADNMRDEIEENNQRLSDGTFTAALDQTKKLGPPKYKKPVPYINFAPLKNALKKLHDAANQYDQISSNLTDRSNEINQLLFTSERLMTRKEGLPGRDWYKHHIYAPGFYTGYGVKTIPGVREAIEQGNYTLLEEQIDVAADVINGISDRIHSIVSIMGK